MSGFLSSISNGDQIVFAQNADFSGSGVPSHTNGILTNGQLWIGTTTPNAGGSHIDVGTLTAGAGVTITNGPGTITIASTAATTDLHTARFIVASSTAGTGANYTSIAAAIAAAQGTGINSTIFIQPGTYTENLTMVGGINLSAFECDASPSGLSNVIISGKLAMATAGTVTISGIQLQTNSDFLIALTGSAASVLNLNNCYLNCLNHTGISFTTSNTGAFLTLTNCNGNLATTGIGFFANTSTGNMYIQNGSISNLGSSTTASTVSAGVLNCSYTSFAFPLTLSGTAATTSVYSTFANGPLNTTMLTLGGSGIQSFKWCGIQSGSASSVSIGGTAILELCDINSTNTNAITGAGTVTYSGLVFSGTSSTINTTTQTNSGTLQGSKNTAPSTGFLGEYISSAVTAISVVSTTPTTIISINLTPGVWNISTLAHFTSSTNNMQAAVLGISTSTNTFQGNFGDQKATDNPNTTTTAGISLCVPDFRVVLTASATYFCIGQINSAGTLAVDARISATRVG